jgi:hypothetical protein
MHKEVHVVFPAKTLGPQEGLYIHPLLLQFFLMARLSTPIKRSLSAFPSVDISLEPLRDFVLVVVEGPAVELSNAGR